MPTIVLDDIPDKITAGDSFAWKKHYADYPASDGWVLSYALVMTGTIITLQGAPDGDDHLISKAAADTADYLVGIYFWQSYVTKAAERYTLETGRIEILPNFAAQASGLDTRPHCFVLLDAIQAVNESRATEDHLNVSFGGRSVGKMSLGELKEAEHRGRSASAMPGCAGTAWGAVNQPAVKSRFGFEYGPDNTDALVKSTELLCVGEGRSL